MQRYGTEDALCAPADRGRCRVQLGRAARRDPGSGHTSPRRQALCRARTQGGTVGCRQLKGRCGLLLGQAGEVLPTRSGTHSRGGPELGLDGFGQGTIQVARKLEALSVLQFSGKIGVSIVRTLSSGGACVLALRSSSLASAAT